jgi:hypothetical protein
MNRTVLPTSAADEQFLQGVWARMFGKFIQCAREKAGRSIEQTAALAGMDAAQWSGVEAGVFLPVTRQDLRVVADAVALEWPEIIQIVCLCSGAWGF